MKKVFIIKNIKNNIKPFTIFIFGGLAFILIAKASMNLELFLSGIFFILLKELLFLILAYFAYKYLFEKNKNLLISYILYYFSLGFFGLFFVEYFFNKNYEFGFFVLFFLFLLKALEVSVARIFIDKIVSPKVREMFLKNVLLFYLIFISISMFFYFILSSRLIWSFGFVLLCFVLSILFLFFLYRIKIPKKEKIEKPPFDDVAFY
jgi:hypothetical protein